MNRVFLKSIGGFGLPGSSGLQQAGHGFYGGQGGELDGFAAQPGGQAALAFEDQGYLDIQIPLVVVWVVVDHHPRTAGVKAGSGSPAFDHALHETALLGQIVQHRDHDAHGGDG